MSGYQVPGESHLTQSFNAMSFYASDYLPALRLSSSVPELYSLDTIGAEFVDPDRIDMDEDSGEESPMTQYADPALVSHLNCSTTAGALADVQPSYNSRSRGAIAPQQFSPQTPHVQHNPYSTHQPYVHAQYSDSLTCAETSSLSSEHPFLVRPRNVRGKHPLAPLAPVGKNERSVHNPYSFTPTINTPAELPESPTSSTPTSPISSNDSTQFTIPSPSQDGFHHTPSLSSTASMNSSGWSPSAAESTHVPVTTNLNYAMPPPPHVGQHYCRPQGFPILPPQHRICGPYCGSPQYSTPTCSVTPPQPLYYGYVSAAVYQQNRQYLCIPSPGMCGDGSSHSESENGISDDGRSVSSSTLRTSSQSIISVVEESSMASVLATEGVKKKRYRARCPTCSTTPDVKRLRFKRGFTYFVCLRCHFKWRLQGAK